MSEEKKKDLRKEPVLVEIRLNDDICFSVTTNRYLAENYMFYMWKNAPDSSKNIIQFEDEITGRLHNIRASSIRSIRIYKKDK